MANEHHFEMTTISDLANVVNFLTPFLKPRTLFLLEGPMASGKTTLISELLKELGVIDVHSPTYALHHKYETHAFSIHHFDLHRFTSPEDIESSGFWDFFESVNDLFFVEWSNLISDDEWPMNLNKIYIKIIKNENGYRKFTVIF